MDRIKLPDIASNVDLPGHHFLPSPMASFLPGHPLGPALVPDEFQDLRLPCLLQGREWSCVTFSSPPGWLKCCWGPSRCLVCCVTPRRKVPGGRRPSAGRLFPQLAKVRSGGFPALSMALTSVLGAPLLSHAAQARARTETPELGSVVRKGSLGQQSQLCP